MPESALELKVCVYRRDFICLCWEQTYLVQTWKTRPRLFQECGAGLHVLKSYQKWDCQTPLAGILATEPRRSAKQDTCTQCRALAVSLLWDGGQLGCCSAPAPPAAKGTSLPRPTEGQAQSSKENPWCFFGLYRLIFLWGCIYRWNQPGFVPVISFKEKKKSSIIFKATSFGCFYRRTV